MSNEELTTSIDNACIQTIERKIPKHVYIITGMLYFCVVIFTFLGTMWGFPMLVLSLGTLFFSWYFMGTARVSYEYILSGTILNIKRRSGMRVHPIVKDFVSLDLSKTIAAAWQGAEELATAEAEFQSKDKKHRVTYNTSAFDEDNPSFVAYCKGIGAEAGFIVKIYLQPTHELVNLLRNAAPGRVFINEN